jgi:hypothetical protein
MTGTDGGGLRRGIIACVATCLVLTAAGDRARGAEEKRGTGLKRATKLAAYRTAPTPFGGAALPLKVDLSRLFPTPGDQGAQSSCVGWSVGYALKSEQERVEENWSLADAEGRPDLDHVFSPAFIYNQINGGADGGSYFEDALNLVASKGAAVWSVMPYSESDYKTQPTAQALERAKPYRIKSWGTVSTDDLSRIKAQLAAGVPVVFGSQLTAAFNDAFDRPTWIWDSAQDVVDGLHAMILTGYDEDAKSLRLMNSWGTRWADRGCCSVTYDVFKKLATEAYVAPDATNSRTGAAGRAGPAVSISRVEHMKIDGKPSLVFAGDAVLPWAPGDTWNVVLEFHDALRARTDDGRPDVSLGAALAGVMPVYQNSSGKAAASSELYEADSRPTEPKTWTVVVPAAAISAPVAGGSDPLRVQVLAAPRAFIRGEAVAEGAPYSFTVEKGDRIKPSVEEPPTENLVLEFDGKISVADGRRRHAFGLEFVLLDWGNGRRNGRDEMFGALAILDSSGHPLLASPRTWWCYQAGDICLPDPADDNVVILGGTRYRLEWTYVNCDGPEDARTKVLNKDGTLTLYRMKLSVTRSPK